MAGLEIDEHRDGGLSFHLKDEFYVEGRYSPDGHLLVGAVDGHEENGRVRSGKVVLVDLSRGKILFQARVKRAQNPWVSNEGLVTVENWLDWGGSLGGELIAFDSAGSRTWKKRYKANVYGSGMSTDGTRVFVSTCNSDHAPHSCKTWLLDAVTGEIVWVRDGFGEVRFERDVLMIGVMGDTPKPGNQFFPLMPDGAEPEAFREAREAHDERQNRGKPWWVLSRVEAALKDGGQDLEALVLLLEEMESVNPDLDSRSRARGWRYRGEIAERLDQAQRAYECWTRALELDPKVGIKQKHAALGKRLGQSGPSAAR